MQNNSYYLDNRPSFRGEPVVEQFGGSHMVMTNVMQETKTKYISLDTKFRDEYNYNSVVNYNLTLPERINQVKSLRVLSVNLPMTFYNVSSNMDNNVFTLRFDSTSQVITVPEGNYTQTTLTNTINSLLPTDVSLSFSCGTDVSFGSSRFTFKPNTSKKSLTISFAVDVSGNTNKYNVKSHLGWLLGFRKPSYTFSSTHPDNAVFSSIGSEGILDLSGKKYLFLALDEFSNASHSSSFLSYLSRSVVNRNIIARIDMDMRIPFGSYETANLRNGLLVSDMRTYSNERVDLQKCNIQLVDEYGQPVSLNNMDFSLCLELVHS